MLDPDRIRRDSRRGPPGASATADTAGISPAILEPVQRSGAGSRQRSATCGHALKARNREVGALYRAGEQGSRRPAARGARAGSRRGVGEGSADALHRAGTREEPAGTAEPGPRERAGIGPDEDRQPGRSGASGRPPSFDFEPKAHHELGAALGMLDLPRAAKLSGSRFAVLTGARARASSGRSSSSCSMSRRRSAATRKSGSPSSSGRRTLVGTGQLPKFADDLFKIGGTGPLPDSDGRGAADQPARRAKRCPPANCRSATPPTRRVSGAEAGAHGKDTQGLIRQHQFDKVELVKVTGRGVVVRGAGRTHPGRRADPGTPGTALPGGPAFDRGHGARRPPRPLTSRSGCHRRGPTGRSAPAATAATTRRAARGSATGARPARRRGSATP